MKVNKSLLLLIFGMALLLFFAGTNLNEKQSDHAFVNSYHDSKALDISQIYFPLTNTGNINWGSDDFQSVIWEQIAGYNTIVFDQGLWVIGKIDGIPYWAYGKWISAYSPGPIIDGQAAMLINPEDSLRYRVYKLSAGDDDSNPDYQEWPIDFGAPVDEMGEPRIYADQTLWTVYNGLDSTTDGRSNYFDTMAVMPVEVNQTVYVHKGLVPDAENIFSNITFLEYQVINKGMENIDSTYIGFWTDIDFYDAFWNPPGIDTLNQLGYCWYNENSSAWNPGITPPAIGFVQLYGPIVPSDGSSAVFKGNKRENFKNLSLSTFHGIRDDAWIDPLDGNPFSLNHSWNVARGFDMTGDVIVDPASGLTTMFPFSGDPVTNTGWIWETSTGGGAGFVMFSGPFTMAPGDTQWVMFALVPGLGTDPFQSIEAMRKKAAIISQMPYDSLVSGKRAIGIWYAGEAQATVAKAYIKPQIDSLIIQTTFPTPEHENFIAQAIVSGLMTVSTDSISLYDDGEHHDQEANDGIWSVVLPPVDEEDYFSASVIAYDLNTNATFYSDKLATFASVGPLSFDSYTIITSDTLPSPGDRIGIQLTLKNNGFVADALNITSSLVSLDTCATVSPGTDYSTYGDIESGQSANGDQTIFINFSQSCTDSTWISFKVDICSHDKLFWSDTFAIFVQDEPSGVENEGKDIPDKFELSQNYPNPFNPRTMINYQLPTRSAGGPITNDVELSIYNLLGQKVATLVSTRQTAGYYQVEWDASGFASGIYYYMIQAGEYQVIRKMVLVR